MKNKAIESANRPMASIHLGWKSPVLGVSKEGKEYASKNGINVADSLRNILADINHADFWGKPIDDSLYQEAINKYQSFSSTFGIDLQDVIKTLEGMRDRDK